MECVRPNPAMTAFHFPLQNNVEPAQVYSLLCFLDQINTKSATDPDMVDFWGKVVQYAAALGLWELCDYILQKKPTMPVLHIQNIYRSHIVNPNVLSKLEIEVEQGNGHVEPCILLRMLIDSVNEENLQLYEGLLKILVKCLAKGTKLCTEFDLGYFDVYHNWSRVDTPTNLLELLSMDVDPDEMNMPNTPTQHPIVRTFIKIIMSQGNVDYTKILVEMIIANAPNGRDSLKYKGWEGIDLLFKMAIRSFVDCHLQYLIQEKLHLVHNQMGYLYFPQANMSIMEDSFQERVLDHPTYYIPLSGSRPWELLLKHAIPTPPARFFQSFQLEPSSIVTSRDLNHVYQYDPQWVLNNIGRIVNDHVNGRGYQFGGLKLLEQFLKDHPTVNFDVAEIIKDFNPRIVIDDLVLLYMYSIYRPQYISSIIDCLHGIEVDIIDQIETDWTGRKLPKSPNTNYLLQLKKEEPLSQDLKTHESNLIELYKFCEKLLDIRHTWEEYISKKRNPFLYLERRIFMLQHKEDRLPKSRISKSLKRKRND